MFWPIADPDLLEELERKAQEKLTPRYAREVRIEQYLEDAAKDWQVSHDLMEWLLLDDRGLRRVYAKSLVDFVDRLVEEELKEEAS